MHFMGGLRPPVQLLRVQTFTLHFPLYDDGDDFESGGTAVYPMSALWARASRVFDDCV